MTRTSHTLSLPGDRLDAIKPLTGELRARLRVTFPGMPTCLSRSFVLVAVVAMLLTGCMSTSYPWPSDWPALSADAPGAACPTLDGFYENTAEAADHPRFPDSFRQDLAARLLHAAPPKGLGRVGLRQPNADTLEVTVFDLTGQTLHQGTLRASAGDFACEAGTLWLRGITTVQKDGTGYGRSTERLGLRLASDGALAGQQAMLGAAAIGWIVPIALQQTFWYRWEAVRAREPSQRGTAP